MRPFQAGDQTILWHGIGLGQTKAQIEMMVRDAGFKFWTILHPAFLMNKFHRPTASFMFPELVADCTLLTAYNPDTYMTVVDPSDVGKFAAAAILQPQRFHGRHIDLGAESLNPKELARELSQASGKEIAVKFYSQDQAEGLAASSPRLWAQLWANEVGYQVNFQELEKYQIPMTGSAQYLENHRGKLTDV